MVSSRNITLTVFLFLLMLAAACAPTAAEPGLAPEIFITPGPPETILLSNEEIMQDNCNGGAMMSQTVERSYTVSRTLELGAAISVDAGGRAGIPGVGEVGVGAAVASHYNVSYGSEETVTRSVTVATEKGQHILHTVRQNMLWETGTLVVAGATDPIPYRFRKDFSMEELPPANLGCPGGAQPVDPGPAPQPTATSTGQTNLEQPPCIHPVTLAAQMGWVGRGIVDLYGGYEVELSANSDLPPLWEANGARQIRQLDTDRTMTSGVWTIYTPYACRNEFDFEK